MTLKKAGMSDLRLHQPGRLLSKESDSSTWVSQSKGFWPAEYNDPLFYTFMYLLISFSGAILIHSAIIHRKKFKAVRMAVDTSAVCGILIGIMCLISYNRPDPTKTAIMRDLIAFGFLQAIVQYCDTYMFYKSYAVVVKVPAWKRYLIFSYIWFVVILTWFFKWNIVPFFSSPSNLIYIDAFFILDRISYYGIIVFNFLFTIGFVFELVKISDKAPNAKAGKDRTRTRLLIASAIGHCVTSSFASLYRTLITTDFATFPEWLFILIVGLHVWFNMKIEKFYGYVSGFTLKSGSNSKKSEMFLSIHKNISRGSSVAPPSQPPSLTNSLTKKPDSVVVLLQSTDASLRIVPELTREEV